MTAAIFTSDRAAPRKPLRARMVATITRLPVPSETALSHRRLIAAVSSRDTKAFMELFNYFAPRLKAYMKKLGTTDELAEELVQDVLFTVWRKSESYDPSKSAVSSWIFTIARNLRIDALRREQRRAFDPTEPALEPAPVPQPDARITFVDEQSRVRSVLEALPREQAAVVSLAFYEGKSHGEIACDLAIPLGTVKSRMRLAFQRLREALQPAQPALPVRAAA
ncbi:MAG TPA: sigma-70 family RNA polymerase sigma factor [Stellaceae bacterium]|nr:sigma-70 family RNA polymerase sigma factor [Stellaceae bacterium]